MNFGLLGVFALGVFFMIAPMLPFFNVGLGSGALLSSFGLILTILSLAIIVFTRLYKKATPSLAFVRTNARRSKANDSGQGVEGGPLVVIDGGAIVLPFLHNVVDVLLETMRADVLCENEGALYTSDNIRVDIHAGFFIRIPKDPKSIQDAATTLGAGCSDPRVLKERVNEKIVSALRTVVASMTFQALKSDRAAFLEQVQLAAGHSLQANGLTIETPTISKLDQTDMRFLKPEGNIIDAEGQRTITRITSEAKVETTKLRAEADRQAAVLEVERDNALAELARQRAEAAATATAAQQMAIAEREREARQKRAEQERMAGLAEVERDRTIAVARMEQEQAVAVATQERQGAEQVAQSHAQQAVQVAAEERAAAVEAAKQRKAVAEKARAEAEAEAETARQAVLTVTAVQNANREKAAAVINKQAAVEQKALEDRTNADVEAYTSIKKAEGELESAQKKADATRIEAEAQKAARMLTAEGDQAGQMVPVNVAAKQVEVDRSRVEVLAQELKTKTENSAIAKELEITLAQILADKEARIAFANAMGEALGKANMTIWGSPEAVRQMSEAFQDAQAMGQRVSGFVTGLPENFAGSAGQVVSAILTKLGITLPTEVVENAIRTTVAERGNSAHGDTAHA